MPARLIHGPALDASLRQSGQVAQRAVVAVTRLHQAAKAAKRSHAAEKFDPRKLVKFHEELTDPDTLAAMTPRQLCLVAWSVGRLQLGSLTEAEELPRLVASRASDMDAQGISMTLWSFAALAVQGPLVEVVLGHAAVAVPQMSAQGVSNTLWACASLRQFHKPLLLAVEAVPASILSAGSTQAVANVVWATARLSVESPLQRAAVAVAQQRARELRAEEAAAVLWALAALAQGKACEETLAVMSVVSEQALRQRTPKAMAASAWAFATLAVTGPFWPRMAAATLTVLGAQGFSPQELAHTCWAFATVLCSRRAMPGLWTALARAALGQTKLSPTELAAVSWSMAAVRFVCPEWSANLPRLCKGCRGMNLRALASVAWSWTTLAFSSRFLEEEVMPAADKEVHFHLQQLGTGSSLERPKPEVHRELLDPLLQLVWAFSFAKVRAEPLMTSASSLAIEIGRRWDSCLPFKAPGDEAPADVTEGPEPEILLSADGILFLHKPPGWEVDGGKDAVPRPGSSPPKLSSFLRELYPHPVLRDLACGFGFLGRLDLPSEGLVLAATSYQAYYTLRLQQDCERREA